MHTFLKNKQKLCLCFLKNPFRFVCRGRKENIASIFLVAPSTFQMRSISSIHYLDPPVNVWELAIRKNGIVSVRARRKWVSLLHFIQFLSSYFIYLVTPHGRWWPISSSLEGKVFTPGMGSYRSGTELKYFSFVRGNRGGGEVVFRY